MGPQPEKSIFTATDLDDKSREYGFKSGSTYWRVVAEELYRSAFYLHRIQKGLENEPAGQVNEPAGQVNVETLINRHKLLMDRNWLPRSLNRSSTLLASCATESIMKLMLVQEKESGYRDRLFGAALEFAKVKKNFLMEIFSIRQNRGHDLPYLYKAKLNVDGYIGCEVNHPVENLLQYMKVIITSLGRYPVGLCPAGTEMQITERTATRYNLLSCSTHHRRSNTLEVISPYMTDDQWETFRELRGRLYLYAKRKDLYWAREILENESL